MVGTYAFILGLAAATLDMLAMCKAMTVSVSGDQVGTTVGAHGVQAYTRKPH